MMICGKEYAVVGQVKISGGVSVPLVDVPMMDDEKLQREAVKNAVDNYIKEFGREPKTEQEAAQWQRRECEEAARKHRGERIRIGEDGRIIG